MNKIYTKSASLAKNRANCQKSKNQPWSACLALESICPCAMSVIPAKLQFYKFVYFNNPCSIQISIFWRSSFPNSSLNWVLALSKRTFPQPERPCLNVFFFVRKSQKNNCSLNFQRIPFKFATLPRHRNLALPNILC